MKLLKKRLKGNKLASVEIERGEAGGKIYGVWLNCPRKNEITFSGTIISTLNTALIAGFHKKYQLIADDEGIQGFYKGNCLQLKNVDDRTELIGLVEENLANWGEEDDIFNFYELMLKCLFEYDVKRRVEILKLKKNEDSFNRIQEILYAMLTSAKSADFSKKVLEAVKIASRNPLAVPYLQIM